MKKMKNLDFYLFFYDYIGYLNLDELFLLLFTNSNINISLRQDSSNQLVFQIRDIYKSYFKKNIVNNRTLSRGKKTRKYEYKVNDSITLNDLHWKQGIICKKIENFQTNDMWGYFRNIFQNIIKNQNNEYYFTVRNINESDGSFKLWYKINKRISNTDLIKFHPVSLLWISDKEVLITYIIIIKTLCIENKLSNISNKTIWVEINSDEILKVFPQQSNINFCDCVKKFIDYLNKNKLKLNISKNIKLEINCKLQKNRNYKLTFTQNTFWSNVFFQV